jgi:hypothetical protein
MLNRIWIYIAISLGLAFIVWGYFSFESWKFRQEVLEELGPTLADEQEQKNALLALGEVDLNPSGLTLATLEQKLKKSVLKRPGDFNTTRLGWACGKERCAIWATFLVPIGQDIPPNATPVGLTIKSPAAGAFPNISIGEFHLGDSDKKLVELSKGAVGAGSTTLFHPFSWDKDWNAAWPSLDGRVFEFVFANRTLQRRLMNAPQSAAPAPTK